MNNNIISSYPDKVIEMARATDSSGKETYTKSQMPSQKQASSKHDFLDGRGMMQSAKNMSGGLTNINKELRNLEGINNVSNKTPSSNLPQPQIEQPFQIFIPFPVFRPNTNFVPSVGRKPGLIDLEIHNFSSAEELKKWLSFLNIIFFYKKNCISFLKELFQGGEFDQNSSLFRYKDLVIILESQQFVRELQLELPFGGWYNKNNLEYGFDLISLCICHLKIEFGKLIIMYSKIAENLYNLKKIRNKDEQPWIIQVKLPITSYDFRKIKIRGAQKIHESRYYTAYHVLQKIVEYWKLSNGEIISVYYTLWKPWNSQIYFCQMLNPQPPYCLYNLHLIHDNPGAEIIFVKNEKIADYIQNLNEAKENTITTCYGGHRKLLEAELRDLKNRTVIIVVYPDTPEIQLIPSIIIKFSNTELRELYFTFDEDKTRVSAQEFMIDPGKWGCVIETENEKNPKNKYKIVPSGVKAEGEDTENKILLHPIIEEGNIIWIFGEAKSFKSWIGYTIACSLSIGNLFVGKWKSGDAVKVLYIDGEMRPNKIRKRLSLIQKGLGYRFNERPFDIYIVKDSSGVNIDTDILSEEWQKKMEAELKGIDVIIIDNFYSLTDNSQKAVKSAITSFGKLTQAGKTIIVLDHSNREGDLQGSIAKERAADLVIKIEPDKEVKNKVKISLPKPRDLHPNDTESFELLMVFEDAAFKMELVNDEDKNVKTLSDRDLKIALVHELTTARGVDREQIMKMLQIKQATYYKYMKKSCPELSEQQKLQVKSEADRLLKALSL